MKLLDLFKRKPVVKSCMNCGWLEVSDMFGTTAGDVVFTTRTCKNKNVTMEDMTCTRNNQHWEPKDKRSY